MASSFAEWHFAAHMPPRPVAPESTEAVAERLKVLRLALGLDQAEIARRAGISASAWNNAETGDNRIGISNAIKLRTAFNIGLDYVFCGDLRVLPAELQREIARLNAPQSRSKRA
jgi:transcriptional regulator with XRE-family HTH domain